MYEALFIYLTAAISAAVGSKLLLHLYEIIQKGILVKGFILAKELSSIHAECTKYTAPLMRSSHSYNWSYSMCCPHLPSNQRIMDKDRFISNSKSESSRYM